MPLKYVLDEHLRGLFWRYIQRREARGVVPIDVVRAGDFEDLALGEPDSWLLVWAERENRILVSRDQRTLPIHLAEHLKSGRHSPGVFLLRSGPVVRAVEFMVCAAYASEESEWADRITFIP
jgi:hypothetical protein